MQYPEICLDGLNIAARLSARSLRPPRPRGRGHPSCSRRGLRRPERFISTALPGKEGQRAEERGERGGRKNRDAIAEPPLMPREAHPYLSPLRGERGENLIF